MKRNAFTLVELLAVIVILAVIALITIPAVMKMIDNATTNSYRRSIDLYGKSVSQGIISYESDMVEKGRKIDVSFQNIMDYIEYEGNDVECNNKIIYSDKTILLTECSVDEELVYGEKGKGYGDNNYYYYTNSKKKMKLIEYIKAVEEAIEDKNISGTCTIGEDKITCNNEEITIKSNLENAIEGSLTIENNKVKSYSNLKFETEKKVIKQEEIPEVVDEIITGPDDNSNNQNSDQNNNDDNNSNENNNNSQEPDKKICKSKTGSISTEPGTEYECEVKDGTKYNFYVLSKEGDKVNLIMDRNICDDGSVNYSSMNNYCRCEWNEFVTMESDPSYSFGPKVAMYTVYNATKSWKNIPDMVMDYTQSPDGYVMNHYGYQSIRTDINTKKTRILGLNDKVIAEMGTTKKPLKARIPKKKEMIDVGCTTSSDSCPSWLVQNLDGQKVSGYWILTFSYMVDRGSYVHIMVNGINLNRQINSESYDNDKINGVRPVITVSISDLS